jgi:hypothetical protein
MARSGSIAFFTESIAGFVGAAAIGIAGAFLTDKTVPKWLLLLIAAGGLALWAGAVVTPWPDQSRVTKTLAKIGAVGTVLLIGASTIAFVMAARNDPDFRSGYDDMDASLMGCMHAESTLIGTGGPALRDVQSTVVGHVEIHRSNACDSVWAVAVLNPTASQAAGNRVMFLLRREGDGKESISRVSVKDYDPASPREHLGISNMLAVNNACVSAEVFFDGDTDDKNHAKTECVS